VQQLRCPEKRDIEYTANNTRIKPPTLYSHHVRHFFMFRSESFTFLATFLSLILSIVLSFYPLISFSLPKLYFVSSNGILHRVLIQVFMSVRFRCISYFIHYLTRTVHTRQQTLCLKRAQFHPPHCASTIRPVIAVSDLITQAFSD
jgi:hypothetical protein